MTTKMSPSSSEAGTGAPRSSRTMLDLKFTLLANIGDEARPFAIEVLKNDSPSHGILSEVIR
jgi:hypothetical protein